MGDLSGLYTVAATDWALKAAGQKHSGRTGSVSTVVLPRASFGALRCEVIPPALQRAEETDDEGCVALSGGRSGGPLVTGSAPKTERNDERRSERCQYAMVPDDRPLDPEALWLLNNCKYSWGAGNGDM
ncbi:hypothetical protein NDU88_003315 [Pleurodeles waltl]|uniref:Uncharacterized protein n=1 Tax=Pleurodeles waltl TaxID=8319 RepID=A0AAV7NJ06_PLEWA|nr:hypothetical protein NDU88_003315 [Pleurodeles waltl]